MTVDVAIAQRPMAGELVCGDDFAIARDATTTTIAIADGLGHGPAAAEAARQFCAFVSAHPGRDLEFLLREAGAAIAKTRGAAAAILRVDESARRLSFAGVGNIEMRSLGGAFHPVCTPGIVGRPIRRVTCFAHEFRGDQLILLHSDGISTRFDMETYRSLPSDEMAKTILSNHGKDHDDATCIVVRCPGAPAVVE